MISDQVAMTTSSASAVIDGHRKVTTPAKMPVDAREGDPPSVDEQWVAIAADTAVMPSTNANAPPQEHELQSVIPGHTSVASPKNTAPHRGRRAASSYDVGPHHDVAPTVGACSVARSSAAHASELRRR
jgi:hypothetical protein